MTLLICLKRCSTCKGIEQMLEEKSIEYTYREIDIDTPSADEIKDLHKKSGLDINKFFNTSGIKYRELNIKDKKDKMSDEEIYNLLASDGMLIKRPILLIDNQVLVGPQVKKYLSDL